MELRNSSKGAIPKVVENRNSSRGRGRPPTNSGNNISISLDSSIGKPASTPRVVHSPVVKSSVNTQDRVPIGSAKQSNTSRTGSLN